MDGSRPNTRKRLALLLALIATVGIVVCASVFYINQSTKKQLADSAETTELKPATVNEAAVTTAAASPAPEEENKEIFIDHAQVQETPKKVVAPKRFKNRSRNSIAMKFPAPPVTPSASNMTSANGGEVEMWAGDKRTFVSVPPGTKFEE